MKFGATTNPFNPVVEDIKNLSKTGIDFIELVIENPKSYIDNLSEQKKEILDTVSSLNIGLMAHLPAFINISEFNRNVRKLIQDDILKSIEVSNELGIKKAVIHPGYIRGLSYYLKKELKDDTFNFLEKACNKAEELGIILCIENLPPECGSWIAAKDFKEIFEKFKNIKLTLDVGHANIFVDKNRSFEFIEMFPDKIKHVHISDNFGMKDDHYPPGYGLIDFKSIISALKKINFDETITLEIPTYDYDFLRMGLEKFKQMWK